MSHQLVGLQPRRLVEQTRIADLADDVVADTNHYTILMGGPGASAVADALTHAP